MAKTSSGTTLIIVLLIGAFALGSSNSSSSGSSSSSSSPTDDLFGSSGNTCDNATSFDGSGGTFVAPTVNGNDRGCVLTVDEGSGAPVQALQSTLRNCYFVGLEADGDFGPATQAGLQAAQAHEGLNPDGNYGPETAAALPWPTMNSDGDLSCQKQS
jgi:peptidoglycan hydrolase-like protein with peptidoglycan-binding domain